MNKERPRECEKPYFLLFFAEIQSCSALTRREGAERVHQKVRGRKEKKQGEKLPRRMRGNLYLHVCSLSSSLPQQKAFISFSSAKKNIFGNLLVTSSFSFSPEQHGYTNTADTTFPRFCFGLTQLSCCRFQLVSLQISFRLSFFVSNISQCLFMLLHCQFTSDGNCSEILFGCPLKAQMV